MEGPFQPGVVLAGKYVVERTIGKGGSGFVLAAQHLVLKQRVAVKLLHDAVAGIPEATARFLREAQTVARLTGAHTVRIMDADRLDDGRPYIVMEYLEGRDLRVVARDVGRVDPRVAANYVAQACEGIAEAHACGIVHRDLKPSNLFLTTDARARSVVKVLDFGVSKLSPLPDELADNLEMTRSHQVFGSPHFMSPEQMRSARDAAAPTDIWSLGVTLFVLVTGRYPYQGEGLIGLDRAIREGPRPALDADAPAALGAIVERCLQFEPSRRYATAGELGLALSRFADGESSLIAAKRRVDEPDPLLMAPAQESRQSLVAARGVAEDRAAAISAGWGPIVVEQAVAPSTRESPRVAITRIAALGLAALAVMLVVWLIMPSIAHRAEAGRGAAPAAQPFASRATDSPVLAQNTARQTASIATPTPPGPRSLATTGPSNEPPAAPDQHSSAAPDPTAHAARASRSGAERSARRIATEPSTERATAATAPRPTSPGDTTLRDFDMINNLPRR